jgi:hypothetical protein
VAFLIIPNNQISASEPKR